MKKLRSLVAAVVAAACLYTPTAAAEPNVFENLGTDSMSQVNDPSDVEESLGPEGSETSDEADAASGNDGEPTVESGDTAQPNAGDNGVPSGSEGNEVHSGEGDGANMLPEGESGAVDAEQPEFETATPETDVPQPVAQDWTDDTDNLTFSTTGLTITPDQTVAGSESDGLRSDQDEADIAGMSVIPDGLNGTGVVRGQLDETPLTSGLLAAAAPTNGDAEGNADVQESGEWTTAQLPETIEATLNLTFVLDAAAGEGRADGSGAGVIVPGDTFSAALPEGMEAADDGTAFDVFACDVEGNRTTTRVAAGTVSDNMLTVTFMEPVDTATGEPMDATASVHASIDLPVRMDASLVKDEAGTVDWTVRQVRDTTQALTVDSGDVNNTDAGNETRPDVLQLPIPSKADVLKMLGLTSVEDADGTPRPESDSDENPDSASEALANGANAVAGTTTETKAGPFDTQVSSQTIWCDNNSGKRPTPESLEGGFIPQYSLDAGQTYRDLVDASGKVTEQAKTDLHLTPEDAARIEGSGLIQITRSATNTYSVITSALPSKVVTTTTSPALDDEGNPTFGEDGKQLFDTTETSTPIKWQLKDTNAYSGYVPGSNSTWEKQYKMLTTDVEFNVVGKVGDQKLKDIFGSDEAKDFQFGASIDNKDQGSISVAEAVDKGWVTITDTDDGCTITGTLPMYDEQGYPIVYYVKYTGADSGADYYQASYDNSASASHGSANDAVYPGGTMTLRHAGTTTFNGTKVWLDGNNQANRPEVTYTLWRYSTQGSPATASQVSVASLNSENPDASAPNAVGFVEVTALAGSDEIDLHKLLVGQYGEELINSLPKYDPDGYPYIYCMREEPISGYEQVFGSVNADGSVSDTAPRYENEAGTGFVDVKRESRPDTDRFVYNGGTLSNRLTGTTSTQMTKTWEIAAFQDSLQNVVCEFTAQSRVKGSDDEAAWQNVNASNAVQALTSWNAETLTKTVSESFPKYDAHGNELEYRWIESNVTIDGRDTGFTQNADGTASFTVNLTNSEGATEELQFTSTPETVKNDDGSFATTIVNTFENVTDQHVDKYWEQADGTLAQIAPDPAYSDGDATVQLFQDGVLIGDFTMDGKTDPDVYDIDGLEGATWQETRSYHIDFEGLPKYSADGKRYTYLVLETNKDGWATERTYDPETRTTRIDNYFPEGEGSEIRVTKKWIDGDDAEHRYKVEVTLYAARDMESQAKDADGNPLHSYKQGDPVMEGIELSEGEQWFTEVDVPIGGLTYKDFYAQETALIADDGTRYPVVTIDEAKAQYPNEDWVNAGWTNPDNRRVATPEHVYEVRYQENSTLQSLEVTNRRLGLFDLTVTKTWNDALGTDEDGTRPEATLTLSCDEYPEAFSLDENGNLQVSVSGNILPVTVTDETGSAITVTIVDADGNSADKGSARIQVDTTKQSATYQFEGMPKYDANGMNVHYSVNETWDSTDHGDYYSTKTVGEYVVEPNKRHFEDHQQVDFANNRSGTRDVVFYKEWHDNYVSEELNQRPDIYLTLYRTSANQTEPEAVPGYIHFNWSALAEEGDAANEQKVTISDLSKYDSKGAEYIYYASEAMSADGTSLGYTDVQFNYDSIEEADAQAEAEAKGALVAQGAENAVKVGDTAGDNPEENGTGWAIREDGTFVNRLGGNLTAQGTKLWENVPGIVSQVSTDDSAQGDLPAVTIYLQQKLTSTVKWPDAFATQKADGTWEVSGTVASASELKQVTTNQYTYTIDKDYQGDPLPRYDEKGNRFEYRAIEIMWGLLDQPGGFTADDLKGVNLAEVRDDDGAALVGAVYVIQHGETGSFLLRNVYGGNEKGKLTVKKLVAGLDQGDEYPDVTFEVYRYYKGYKGDANESSPAELVAPPQTISGKDFSSGQATITFDNLDVYAPDGSRWIYFVAERSIGGYTTTVGTGDIDSVPDKHLVSGQMIDGAGVVVEEGGVAIRSEDLGNADETAIHDDKKVDVTFANAYEPGSTSLNGTKKWSDYDNIFSVRPGAINLTFTRTAGGMTEDVATQSNDPGAANYLKWTAQGTTGDWTFTLSNIEQWAPNGQAWEYHVSETLSDDGLNHYTIVTGTSSATAGTSDSFTLQNALNGKATVVKNWVDGGDPYGLRPETVTVQLQARNRTAETTSGGDAGKWSEWTSAYEVWKKFANEQDLNDQQFTEDYTKRVLSDTNGWRASWSRLPVLARETADKPLNEIEYRVVEIKIGDLNVDSSADEDGKYGGTTGSYQPSQEQVTQDAVNSFATRITNTLKGTEISATKTWANDTVNDTADAWGTRPTSNGTWSVTYLLQVRLKNAEHEDEWQWLMVYGAEQAAIEDPTNGNIVSKTITGLTGEATKVANWKNLPKTDAEGKLYEYRVVERVPGGYDVTDKTAEPIVDAEDNPVTATIGTVHYRYYVVDNTNAAQSFTNTLRTVGLTGTKAWEDYGTGIAPKFGEGNLPQMTLYRSVNGSNEQQVPYLYNGGQPEWTENNGIWTYTYENLPAADKNDNAYTYWAEEAAGSVDGFYPTYGAVDAAGTMVKDPDSGDVLNPQQGTIITNTATRFTLDKVSDWDVDDQTDGVQHEQLPLEGSGETVELSVKGADGGNKAKTYAVWTRDDSGKETAKVWVGGTDDTSQGGVVTSSDDVGWIVGLAAGDYVVTETGEAPDGYAKAQDVPITIGKDGAISSTSEGVVSVEGTNPGGTVVVTVTDPVFRGQVELVKTVKGASSEALAGARFELWRKGENGVDDVKIAEGITTGADGKWASKDEGESVAFLTKEDGKRTNLSDGLLPGTYYFLEVDSTPGAWQPSGDEAKFEFVIERDAAGQSTHHQVVVKRDAENEDFSATVILHKFDATDGAQNAGIDGVEFTLSWPLEDGTTGSRKVTTTNGGTLTLSGLEKREYTLKETANAGYDMTDPFTATFTIDNDNYDDANNRNLTYDITDRDGEAAKAIDFAVTGGVGSYDDAHGIGNERLRGSVTIEKVSAENTATKVDGATFELQRKNGSDWTNPVVVAQGLLSDHLYEMNDANTAVVEDDPLKTEIATSSGQLVVHNLIWGTYRFVETAPKPGYTGVKGEGSQATAVTSSDLVVGRASLNPSLTGDKAVKNTPTSLELNKRNEDGQALAGAKFTVTPVDGSAFADLTAMGTDYDAATGAITLTTNGSGLATLKAQLIVGDTYEIYESKAPTGYDPVDETFRVSVQNDGTLAVVGGDNALPKRYKRYGADGFSFIATNDHLAIKLQKVSAADDTVKLEGVQYTLVGPCMANPDSTSSHPFTTDANGEISIDIGLLGGVKYTLSEDNTPDGYVRMTDVWHFMINDRGEIETYPDTTRPDEITVNDDRISITAKNKPVNLQITKRAPAQEYGTPGKTLEGAEFTVTPADDSTFANKVDGSKTNPRTITTGSEGVASMTAELVVGGTYDITETEAPKGYEKVGGTIRITVDTNGTINVLGSVADDGTVNSQAPAGYTKVRGNAFEVQVENQPIEIGLVKVEADNTATVLAGAEFEIQGVFADSPGRPEIRTFTTNADGTLIYQDATLDNLSEVFVGGTKYTLDEAQAPAGYTLIADPWTFTVTEGGEIETSDPLAAPGESGFAIGADKVTIMAMDESVEASLVKTGIDGPSADTMVGAKFTLTGDFVNDEHDVVEGRTLTLTTGVDGTLNLFGMKDLADPNDQHTYGLIADNGKYVLTEIEAPQGYEVIEEPFTFTVGTDGRLSPVSAQADAGTEGYTLTAAGARITATDTPIRVRLQKAGSDTDGGLLDGATFTLSRVTADADGGESETVLDDDIAPTAAGAVELTGLVGGGTYRLHESEAPAGYELMDDLTFTVDANGEVAIADNGQWAAASADGTVTITATDPAIEVMFDKRDLDGNLLPGAVFQIEGRFVNDATRALDAEPRTLALTMGESGTLALKGMADEDGVTYSLVAGQRYMLTEATAPNGYEVIGSFEFTVNPDGTVTAEPGREAAEGEPGYRLSNGEDGVVSVTAFDGPIEVVLYKQSAEGEPLSGAEFRIEGCFVDEATHVLDAEPRAIDLRMDGDSLVLAGMVSGGSTYGLVAGGQYVLTETKAPAGYELIEGGMAFVVGANGTIMATGPNYPFYTVSLSSAEVSITAHDDPIELAIAKVDENGKPLEGAEFMITGDFVGPDGTVEAGSRTVAPGTDPVVVDGFVADGEYVIAETKAPEGYAQVEDVTFVVNADGTITITSGNADGSYTVSDEDEHGIVTISVTNERIPEMSTTGSGTAPAALLAVALLTLGAAIALQRRTMPAGSARGRHRR